VPEDHLESLWNAVRAELRRETPDFKFHIWLNPLELAAVEGRTLVIKAPEHIRTSVAERYLPLLRRAAGAVLHERATVEIVGLDWTPAPAGSGRPDAAAEEPGPGSSATRFNPRYTFDQFVIGEGNRFAHAAALAVAELPAQAYNPLFLHGAPGLGKTHLLHAIGSYVQQYGGGLGVRYATSDDFTSAFVNAVRDRNTGDFKERFRGADLLLLDDVQFLSGRERTREEFFHTFNALVASGSQIVLTSDRSPDELSDLEARLAERFRSGLVVELDAPQLDVRLAILRSRARLDGVEAPDDVLEELAYLVTSSIRALEGALIRVVAYASLRDEPLTPALARHVLRRLGQTPSGNCDIPEILAAAAEEFGVDHDALLARDRRPAVATARQVAMFLARELTDSSLPEIGRGIGDRNHTTVLHAVNRVSAAVRTDPAVRNAVDNLRRRLGHPA
jgi:chromosomal replication initiator protein